MRVQKPKKIKRSALEKTRTVLGEKIRESAVSVLPILIIVVILCLCIVPMRTDLLLTFLIGALLLTVGMGLFSLGAEQSMTLIGSRIGTALTKTKNLPLILGVSFLLGFAITDEIFAVAIQNPGKIKRNYFMGLTIIPIIGWTLGTLGGALLGNILPAIITNALGVALYGMFIAVVVPKARDDSHVFVAVCIAVAISVALKYIPVFADLSGGFAIIICTVVASLIAAVLFPVEVSEDEF